MTIANFTNNQYACATGLCQYDYGQVLRIQGLKLPTAVEIHFGLEEKGGTTTTRIGVTKDGVTDVVIPDSMLENGDTRLDYTIYAFIYLTDDTSGKTVNRIKIKVKARSKPEKFDKPSDAELFYKAIKAVNKSSEEAEGWAHGREDMPERATDNAKYYAGESAKSAEEIKGVEQSVKDMVATIGGIEQQVQDVKEYAGQAKSASEKALLSEQEAKKSEEASLQHRTGAETAENNAELAEQNAKKSEQAVEQAKQLVMQMGQEVLNNKNHVDGKVEAFNKVVTDAVDAVETVGTEQTKKVSDEGAKQVKAVADKGAEVLQSIPKDFQTQMQSKLNKNQGTEHAGKALVIGDDGNVIPGKPQSESEIKTDKTLTQENKAADAKATGDKILQYAIKNTASGESPLIITDSVEEKLQDIKLLGKSEQTQDQPPSPNNPQEIRNVGRYNEDTGKYEVKVKVAGKNLLDIKDITSETPQWTEIPCLIKNNIYIKSNNSTALVENNQARLVVCFKDGTSRVMYDNSMADGLLFKVNSENSITMIKVRGTHIKSGAYSDIQVEYGNEPTSYEPYTEQILTLTSDRQITKWDKLIERDGQIGWLYQSARTTLDGSTQTFVSSNKPDNLYFATTIANALGGHGSSYCETYKNILENAYNEKHAKELCVYGDHSNATAGDKHFRAPNKNVTTLEQWLEWLRQNPIIMLHKTKTTEFIPLPQSEQDAIRALKTYYTTTVIAVDGGEVIPSVEITYTADTKNYIDGKIANYHVMAQANQIAMMSLLPDETQATMIEKDQENLLGGI